MSMSASEKKLRLYSSITVEEDNPYAMTEEILKFRSTYNREAYGKYIKQFYCGVTSSLGAISFGIVLTWPSPAILNFLDERTSAYLEFSSLTTAVPGAAAFGTILAAVLGAQYGPRKVGLLMCITQSGLWIMIGAWQNVDHQYFALFFNGMFSICNIIISQRMIYDCVHEINYYHLIVIFRSSIQFGAVLAFIARLIPSSYEMFYKCFNAGFPLLQFVLLLFSKESPVFLYKNSRKLDAESSLKFYLGTINVNQHMRALQKDADRKLIEISGKYMLMYKVVYKAVLIISILKVFQVYSGYYSFVFFGLSLQNKELFRPNYTTDHYIKVWDGLLRILTYYFASVISNKIHWPMRHKARKVLMLSSILVTISLTMVSILFYCVTLKLVPFYLAFGIKVILEIFFVCSFECGLSNYPDILLYDYLPFQVYPWIIPYIQSFYWLNVCLQTYLTRVLPKIIPVHLCYLMLAGVSLCGCFFTWFFVVECKGRTLLQIQMKLGGQPIGSRISHLIRYKKYYN